MSTLILILAALTVLAVLGGLLICCSSAFLHLIGIFSCLFSAIGLVCLAAMSYSWVASDYQAKIINREYGSLYTKEEVFFASGVIETVRELDRKRIEVNGNVMGESK